jgi:hypothetical protein
MFSRSPLRIRYRPNEPAYAILNRLALRHGAQSASEFCSSRRLNPQLLPRLTFGHGITELAELTGFDGSQIERFTPRLERRAQWLIRNEFLGTNHSGMFTRGRVCPVCVADDLDSLDGPYELRPYRRFFWDIAIVSICTKHSIPLVDACDACGRPLRASCLLDFHCACGASLATHKGRVFATEEFEGDRYAIARLTGSDDLQNVFLDRLGLKNSIALMWAAGLSLSPKRAHDKLRGIDKAQALSLGFNAFVGWPQNSGDVLDEIANKALQMRQGASAHKYGELGALIESNPNDSELKPFRAVLADHWRQRRPVIIPTDTAQRTVQTLKREFDLSDQHMYIMAMRFGYRERRPENQLPAAFYFEQLEALQKIKNFLEQTMSNAETRKVLGINELYLSRFGEEGILRPILGEVNSGDARYLRLDVDSLLNRMRGEALLVRAKSSGLLSIFEFHRIFRVECDFVILAAAKGLISAAAILQGDRGIPSILVRVRDVRLLWQEEVGRSNQASWRFA